MTDCPATSAGRESSGPSDESSDPGADLEPAVAALELQFGTMFSRVRAQFRERAIRVHPDLSPAGYNLLATLVRSGPLHAGALATALDMDKSMISRMVKQLTELSLVERRPDPSDGRAWFLAATPAAVRAVDAVRDERRQELRDFLADWDVADVRQLTALLRRLNGET